MVATTEQFLCECAQCIDKPIACICQWLWEYSQWMLIIRLQNLVVLLISLQRYAMPPKSKAHELCQCMHTICIEWNGSDWLDDSIWSHAYQSKWKKNKQKSLYNNTIHKTSVIRNNLLHEMNWLIYCVAHQRFMVWGRTQPKAMDERINTDKL